MSENLNTLKSESESPRLFVRGGRDYSVDLLRCISCFMVVLIHASRLSIKNYYMDLGIVAGSGTWVGLLIYKAAFVAPTVLFVMISGVFFLTPQRNITAKNVWSKNIPKLACAYVLWSLIFALYRIFFQMDPTPDISLKLIVQQWMVEPTHLWYIPMMLGLYIMVPLFRCVTTSDNAEILCKYSTGILLGATILNTFTKFKFPYFSYYGMLFDHSDVANFCQYGFWMIFGYYLYSFRPSPKARGFLYAAGVVSVIVYVILNIWQFNVYGAIYGDGLSGKFSITSFFKSVAIFVFVTNAFSTVKIEGLAKKILMKISGNTLMIYLCHYMVLYIFIENQIFYSWGINPVIVVWIISILTFACGNLLGDIVHVIPWKKMRNAVLDVFFPNRTVLVTKNKEQVKNKQ